MPIHPCCQEKFFRCKLVAFFLLIPPMAFLVSCGTNGQNRLNTFVVENWKEVIVDIGDNSSSGVGSLHLGFLLLDKGDEIGLIDFKVTRPRKGFLGRVYQEETTTGIITGFSNKNPVLMIPGEDHFEEREGVQKLRLYYKYSYDAFDEWRVVEVTDTGIDLSESELAEKAYVQSILRKAPEVSQVFEAEVAVAKMKR